ncbi:hypothetical protein BC937DRAFT_90694, partial [Endogone sp. FLAS-F59071]
MVNDPFDFTTTNPYNLAPDELPTPPGLQSSLHIHPLATGPAQSTTHSAPKHLYSDSSAAPIPASAAQQTSAAVQAALTAAAAAAQAQAHAHAHQVSAVPIQQGGVSRGSAPANPGVAIATVPQVPTATSAELAMNFEDIQAKLKKVLDCVERGDLLKSFEILSMVTDAVVENCEQLGGCDCRVYFGLLISVSVDIDCPFVRFCINLHTKHCLQSPHPLATGLTADDHPYTTIDREGFWTGLNNCWLYALSRAGAARTEGQHLTDRHFYQLRESAIAWADRLERYGLVDYEMGWWEADVLEAIDTNLAVGMGGLGTAGGVAQGQGRSMAGER